MPCPPPDSDLSTLVKLKYTHPKMDVDVLRNSLVVYKGCWNDAHADHATYIVDYNDLDFYVTRAFANSKGIETDPSPPGSPPRGGRRKTRRKRIVSRHK